MDTKGNSVRIRSDEAVSGIAAPAATTDPISASPEGDGLDGRLRAELEQAQVTIEDLNERISELVRANGELADKLQQETRSRAETERRLSQLCSDMPDDKRDEAEKKMLRQELSMAIEELQIMQEELQAAHDELGRRNQTCSSTQGSAALAR